MKFMTLDNVWRLSILVVMAAVFSRINYFAPFAKGEIVKGCVLCVSSIVLWIVMAAYLSWIRTDAARKALEAEEE